MKIHIKMWRASAVSLVLCSIFIACEAKDPGNVASTDKALSMESKMPLSGEVVDGVREITMRAFQFGFDPDTIVVKKGEKVRLKVTSSDVTHGIDIDALGINRKLPPHKKEIIEFTPQKVGDYHFHCSVYCGVGHGKMHGTLKVVE